MLRTIWSPHLYLSILSGAYVVRHLNCSNISSQSRDLKAKCFASLSPPYSFVQRHDPQGTLSILVLCLCMKFYSASLFHDVHLRISEDILLFVPPVTEHPCLLLLAFSIASNPPQIPHQTPPRNQEVCSLQTKSMIHEDFLAFES